MPKQCQKGHFQVALHQFLCLLEMQSNVCMFYIKVQLCLGPQSKGIPICLPRKLLPQQKAYTNVGNLMPATLKQEFFFNESDRGCFCSVCMQILRQLGSQRYSLMMLSYLLLLPSSRLSEFLKTFQKDQDVFRNCGHIKEDWREFSAIQFQ